MQDQTELPTGCPVCKAIGFRKARVKGVSVGFDEICVECETCASTYVRVHSKWNSIPTALIGLIILAFAAYGFYEYWFVDQRDWKLNFTLSWWGQLLVAAFGVAVLFSSLRIFQRGGATVRLVKNSKGTP